MTTIAVTASSCASASEAALRVASFIPLLPRLVCAVLGTLNPDVHHHGRRRPVARLILTRNTPPTSIRSNESPLSEYRPGKGRTVLRREFVAADNRRASAVGPDELLAS